MKALAHAISMTHGALVVLAATAAGAAGEAHAGGCAAAAGPGSAQYPTFCAIPMPPRDVRTPAQFKSAVVAVRVSGQALARSQAAAPASLPFDAAAGFAAEARAEAAPPPPMTADGDAAAFARAARDAATPPPRPH